MITIEELFKETTYPTWIRTNAVFNRLKYIRKVFPDIGLSNFEEKIVVDNTQEIVSFANQLLDVISDYMSERTAKLVAFSKKAKVGKKRRQNLDMLVSVMSSLSKTLRTNKEGFIIKMPTGKVNLGIPEDLIYNDTVFMKKGTGLLKLYEKFNSMLKENKFVVLPELNQAWQFKNFSSINIPSKETIVKFTAEGKDGVWDIATMSMRGVSSCQTWDAGIGNSGKVIGSMIDPFTGIIYLTCGGNHNNYGAKMIRRCVVRYAIDHASKEPYLLLERMYPAYDKPSLDTFVNALTKRAPKMKVLYSAEIGEKAHVQGSKLSNSYIPLSDELKMLDARFHPYVDSAVTFKEDATCSLAKNTQALKLNFKSKVPQLLEKAVQSRIFKKETVKPFGGDALKIVSQIRGSKPKKEAVEATAKKNDKKVVETTAIVDNKFAEQLGGRFADFVCDKSEGDPFKYLEEHKKECEAFFMSEFGDKIDNKFANFFTSNIVEYINQKNAK